ncbi:hypothetical protein M153_11310001, partial [Pseudoloma neurophilia]
NQDKRAEILLRQMSIFVFLKMENDICKFFSSGQELEFMNID